MGLLQKLLELFTGKANKKPNLRKFRRVLEEAMADGILTEAEIDDIEALKREFGLSEETVQKFRRRAYSIAFRASVEKEPYSPRKERELEHIRSYLKLTDAELRPYTLKLERMRAFYNLEVGNLPRVDVPGLELPRGEQAHWSAHVAVLDDKGQDGAVLRAPEANGSETKLPDWPVANKGVLIATNERFMFKGGGKAFQIELFDVRGISFFQDGLHLDAEAGKSKVLRFLKRTDVELADATLKHVLQRAKVKKSKPQA
ncbi:MAG: hypothetical protein VKN33_06420 [Candidatus Sericytochromatia bacterium]|nr:hypothetical protein [Candidatus Sericytochromatia bacterium]